MITDDFSETMERKEAGFGDRCVSSACCKTRLKHDYLEFRIMSDKQNPHYMEHMINEFLRNLKQTKFSEYVETLANVKADLIKSLEDTNPSV